MTNQSSLYDFGDKYLWDSVSICEILEMLILENKSPYSNACNKWKVNLNLFDAFNDNSIIVLEDLWCNSYILLCYVSFMWVWENKFNDHIHHGDLHKEYLVVTCSVLS